MIDKLFECRICRERQTASQVFETITRTQCPSNAK
ncbi:hypothetical protein OOU_Y34scaffold00228g54 [Pyricularia oryzae Y34]|uniref:Uncharacterized protein n=1 Tax=Pyricularia oryzae (strain Y34) TaxID=1143189 RepID=A0AA97P532_PYRO3|nr:hypothetical protein OOU_Y34scaffold00228g54 [Pyricularia oryzae Y34]